MSDDPSQPPPLDYRSAIARERREQWSPEPGWRGFIMGLAGGTLASFVIWVMGWDRLAHLGSLLPLLIVPTAKVAAAVLLERYWSYRAAAVGVLASIGLGMLIFGWSFISHCGAGYV